VTLNRPPDSDAANPIRKVDNIRPARRTSGSAKPASGASLAQLAVRGSASRAAAASSSEEPAIAKASDGLTW
jgi:hypothetical protein